MAEGLGYDQEQLAIVENQGFGQGIISVVPARLRLGPAGA